MKKIENIQEIEVGKHGLYMVNNTYHGLLLPQVATNYGWNKKIFLEHTCMKAGLPQDAWTDKNTEISKTNRARQQQQQPPKSNELLWADSPRVHPPAPDGEGQEL